ncbi:MAG: hypothetical protein JSS06_03405 [Proteobacteria bacterium]|nr:hypothetical protein [Pseudomonadota bacterium]
MEDALYEIESMRRFVGFSGVPIPAGRNHDAEFPFDLSDYSVREGRFTVRSKPEGKYQNYNRIDSLLIFLMSSPLEGEAVY